MSADGRLPPASRRAYIQCEAITRGSAANFYYGIRLLPAPKRQAMCAVYAFARRIDDIGDGPLDAERKLAMLDRAEHGLATLGDAEHGLTAPGAKREPAALDDIGRAPAMPDDAGRVPRRPHAQVGDEVTIALAHACSRFALPREALRDLIEGVRMDVRGATYETFEDLVPYCRKVAGSIGRLCVAIFGAREQERALALADDLGVAMQLTNILRDVREDAERGRVYLAGEDLVRYQLSLDGRYAGEDGQFEAFMRFQAARAEEWFERGLQLVPLLDRRSAACVLAMSGIYRRLLTRIEQNPELTIHGRISLPAREKVWVAARSLLAGAR